MWTRTQYRRVLLVIVVVQLLVLVGCGIRVGTGTGSPTPGPTPTATIVQTAGCTPSPSPSPTPTAPATLSPTPPPAPTPVPEPTSPPEPSAPPAPLAHGQVILVSLWRQWLYAYTDGSLVFANAVETGMPELPTPVGTFSVLTKERDLTFYSPWPEGSPYHYNPTHINYALLFKEGGYYLHDAWWHVVFGPGGNVPHQLADGRWETGSHGCVGMTIPDAQRLYTWAQLGIPVVVTDQRM